MKNILLCYCRSAHRFSKKKVADFLGITVRKYSQIEKGEALLTADQARLLGKLYHTDPWFFVLAVAQLELLRCRAEVIQMLKGKDHPAPGNHPEQQLVKAVC